MDARIRYMSGTYYYRVLYGRQFDFHLIYELLSLFVSSSYENRALYTILRSYSSRYKMKTDWAERDGAATERWDNIRGKCWGNWLRVNLVCKSMGLVCVCVCESREENYYDRRQIFGKVVFRKGIFIIILSNTYIWSRCWRSMKCERSCQ